jgi:membrane protease YdiL (CAAX protease family)
MSKDKQAGSVLGVSAYLIIAFGIAWGTWIWLLPPATSASHAMFSLYALPGAFAPAFATFVVRQWITREGFADAGLGLHLDKWRYYLVAWFMPFAIIAFIVVSAPLLGFGGPDTSLKHAEVHPNLPAALSHYVAYVTLAGVAFTALIATPVLFGEEFGWRGYLQLRLFPGRPTLAAIVTGIIWGLWHLPIILRGYEFPGDQSIAIIVFCGGAVLISIIFGWLREKSGSIWVTSLAHSATNAIGGSLAALWYPDRAHMVVIGYLGLLSWVPLGLICAWIVVQRAGSSDNNGSRTTLVPQTVP